MRGTGNGAHPPRKSAVTTNQERHSDVTAIQKGSAPVNTGSERELLGHALRTAVNKARHTSSLLEQISVQFRHKLISPDQALDWLRRENLLHLVQIGLPGAKP